MDFLMAEEFYCYLLFLMHCPARDNLLLCRNLIVQMIDLLAL